MYILFDIGATKMRIAASAKLRKFSKPIILPTPKKFSEGIELLVETAHYLAGGKKIQAVSGGIPCAIDNMSGRVVSAGNLKSWIGKSPAKVLQKNLSCKIFLKNDAAMGGLGEAVSGAGQNYPIVAYITVSTGVGGHRIVNKKIDETRYGLEPGGQIIAHDPTGKSKEPQFLGHLIQGSSMEKKYGKKPYEILDKKIWDKQAKLLAVGLHNVSLLWGPDIIVLGGSMMNRIGIPIPQVRTQMKKTLRATPRIPVVRKAKHGDLVGLCGAMEYLKQQKR